MTYLLALKVKYPDKITLLRGHHECRGVTQGYGFYDECQRKYGNSYPWKYFCRVFDYLPLAAVVDGQVLCVHAGLSPEVDCLDQIRTILRNVDTPHEGPFFDLMWSDPEEIENWQVSHHAGGWKR